MKKEKIIRIILVIFLLLLIIIAVFLLRTTDQIVIKEGNFYQYYFGVRNDYVGQVYFTKEERTF